MGGRCGSAWRGSAEGVRIPGGDDGAGVALAQSLFSSSMHGCGAHAPHVFGHCRLVVSMGHCPVSRYTLQAPSEVRSSHSAATAAEVCPATQMRQTAATLKRIAVHGRIGLPDWIRAHTGHSEQQDGVPEVPSCRSEVRRQYKYDLPCEWRL